MDTWLHVQRTRNYTFVGLVCRGKLRSIDQRSQARRGSAEERWRLMDARNTQILWMPIWHCSMCIRSPIRYHSFGGSDRWGWSSLEHPHQPQKYEKNSYRIRLWQLAAEQLVWRKMISYWNWRKWYSEMITNPNAICMEHTTLESPFRNEKGWKIMYNKFALNGQWKWWKRGRSVSGRQAHYAAAHFVFVSLRFAGQVCVWVLLLLCVTIFFRIV